MSIASHFLFVHDKSNAVLLLQLEDGDIICFQKSSQAECCGQFEHPDAPSFLDYVNYYQVINEPSFPSIHAS